MIIIENTDTYGFEHAIRGMRNPMNSWDKSDSKFAFSSVSDNNKKCVGSAFLNTVMNSIKHIVAKFFKDDDGKIEATITNVGVYYILGENDKALCKKLIAAGPEHRKFLRQIMVWADITAPLYWWKEFDTYKVGTSANSCSTMHKIADKPFGLSDFSTDHIICEDLNENYMLRAQIEDHYHEDGVSYPIDILKVIVEMLNQCRTSYLVTKDKKYWWQMIQLLPSSYNQKRTVCLSYEALYSMYHQRQNHKLDEWHTFCDWIKSLPNMEDFL